MKVLTILQAAETLLADPAHWTQGAYARLLDGSATTSDDPAASCWCALGAVNACSHTDKAAGGRASDALNAAAFRLGRTGAAALNDETNYGTVMQMFALAIREAQLLEDANAY